MNIKNNPRFYKVAKKECSLLQSLNSPHIIKLIDAFVNEDYLYMILPLYKMDLFEYIPEVIGKPNKIFKILLGISKGLLYLHESDLMHGDVKPENIMLSDNDEPIIIDLGLAKSYRVIPARRENSLSGTLTYLPPEVIEHRRYTEKMDTWALGIIMYMMMFNREPFTTQSQINKEELFNNIKYKEQFYPLRWKIGRKVIFRDVVIYAKMVELNKWLLRKKDSDRPNMDEVVRTFEDITEDLDKCKSCASIQRSHDLMVEHLHTFKTM